MNINGENLAWITFVLSVAFVIFTIAYFHHKEQVKAFDSGYTQQQKQGGLNYIWVKPSCK